MGVEEPDHWGNTGRLFFSMSGVLHRGLGLLLAILVAVGFCRLSLDTDVLNLLPDAVPEVHGLKLYQSHFVRGRELLIEKNIPLAFPQ